MSGAVKASARVWTKDYPRFTVRMSTAASGRVWGAWDLELRRWVGPPVRRDRLEAYAQARALNAAQDAAQAAQVSK